MLSTDGTEPVRLSDSQAMRCQRTVQEHRPDETGVCPRCKQRKCDRWVAACAALIASGRSI
jgi:hypothetical protein